MPNKKLVYPIGGGGIETLFPLKHEGGNCNGCADKSSAPNSLYLKELNAKTLRTVTSPSSKDFALVAQLLPPREKHKHPAQSRAFQMILER